MQHNLPRITLLLATSLISCALFCREAVAVPIDGTIGFYGLGSASTVGDTTTVSFNNPEQTMFGSGDYSGVPFGTQATFQSITYTGTGTAATLTGSVTPLWTFDYLGATYSFELTGLSSANTTSSSFTLSGFGTAHITGYTPTEGTFAIQGTGPNLTFQFVSASTTANGTAVPDGGSTVALLGFAFVGVEAFRRNLLRFVRGNKT